ncbi:MAG: IPT/TIG domain-containing protein [Thermomicrobiales bacterium]
MVGTDRQLGRALRALAVVGLLAQCVASIGFTSATAEAAGPSPPRVQSPARNPRMPGDHAAQQEDFYRQRLTAAGTVSGAARYTALQRASVLPTARTLPAAIGGKGPTTVGTQTLQPPTGNWLQLGPAPEDSDTVNPVQDYHSGRVSGRATSVVIGPHTGVIYLGTADGGVWKSTNDGGFWTPLTDNQSSLAVGALALDPADASDNTLYVGTGETNYDVLPAPVFNGDSYFGVGVLKTIDGVAHWTLLGAGLPGFNNYSATSVGIGAMAANGNTVWAGTTSGLYQSTNGGTSWAQVTVATGSPNTRVTDIVMDGLNVYAVLGESIGGYSYAGIYKSITGGAPFVPIMSGLPAGTTWSRAQVALAASSAPLLRTLYLTIADASGNLLNVYKTTDSGLTWAATATQPGNYFDGGGGPQGTYDTAIAVDPANANLVYAGGVNVIASTDGGATWRLIGDVYCSGAAICVSPLHPDQHAIAFRLTGTPSQVYLANDGGLWKSTNSNQGTGTTWTDLNSNLATTQFYAGDTTSNYLLTPIVAAGAQDNGTSRSTSSTLGTWGAILGGDGGFVAIDKTAPNTIYAAYPPGPTGGVPIQKTTNANAGTAITWTDLSAATAACTSTALFITPFAMDANDHNHLVLGGDAKLCETKDGGTTWGTSNLSTTFLGYVQSVAIAPTNSAVLYAGTDGGFVYKTVAGNTDAATTWTDCDSNGLPSAPATSLAVDRANPNTLYATFGNFGVGHVFKTTTCTAGGWTNISGNLPDVPVTSLVTYVSTPNPVLIAGTDVGVFISTNNGTSWSALQAGLPNVGIQQLFTDPALTTLFAATHGRGVWKIAIPSDTGPTVSSIDPPSGSTTGGSLVTITGTNFLAGATVVFGGIAGTGVTVGGGGTKITVTAPAHAAGVVDVNVVNPSGIGVVDTLAYTYGVTTALPGQQPNGPGGGLPTGLPPGRVPGPIDGTKPSPLPIQQPR